eukprot:15358811-Ditylum_brightwellii.AAC.1
MQSNDCIHVIHAAFMSFIYIVQILIYNSFSFELRHTTMVLLFMMVAPAVIMPFLLWCGLPKTHCPDAKTALRHGCDPRLNLAICRSWNSEVKVRVL